MNLVDIKIGAEGDVKVDIAAGVLTIEADEQMAGLQGGLKVSIPLTYFVDAAASKLGGGPTAVAVAAMLDGLLKSIA